MSTKSKDRKEVGFVDFSHNIKYCKSTSFLDNKKSRISASFLKTGSSTIISNTSYSKRRPDESCLLASHPLHIDEFDSEESGSPNKLLKADENKVISFSICINETLYKTEENLPLLIRSTIDVSINETLLNVTRRFIEYVNKQIDSKGLCLNLPSNETLEPNDLIVKPMKKKSGKPDMDLPGFELEKRIGEVNYDAFSIVYNKSCLQPKTNKFSNHEKQELVQTQAMSKSLSLKPSGFQNNMSNLTSVNLEHAVYRDSEPPNTVPKTVVPKTANGCCKDCHIF